MRFHRVASIGLACLAVALDFNSNGIVHAETTEDAAPEESAPEYNYPEESKAHDFQADVSRMLDIVINSLYQNKDVFLRELISNSQDAIDKARFLSIKKPDILDAKEELEVRVSADPVERTITITDSGIGMTKKDLVSNLGVVANSGTSKFLDAMKEGTADIDQIGQFGVGFYSAFLVAERVRVASKHPDDSVQHIWESKNGESAFHIYEDPRGDTLGRGTEITLFLKEDAVEYCDEAKIKELAIYYSKFLTHPIHVKKTITYQVPVKKDEEEVEEMLDGETDDDDLAITDEDILDEDEPPKEPEMEDVTEEVWDLVNTNKPIWTREKDEVTEAEYQDFFNAVSKTAHSDAKSWIHFNAEGSINFKSILYLPPTMPSDFMSLETPINEMKLYVKKVLISDSFELLPKYLSFVKGVVDSDDLSLNVNRETLQENKVIRIIRKKLIRKTLEMIKKFSEKEDKKDADEDEAKEVELDAEGNFIEDEPKDEEKKPNAYLKWFEEFGPALKMGALEDAANRERLLKLLRYKSTKTEDYSETRTLQDYVDNMKEWQTQIFYIPGEDMKSIKNSKFLDAFFERDVEVLFFDHPIDEYMINGAPEYAGKKFQAITKSGVSLKDEDQDMTKRRGKVYTDKFKNLTKFLKSTFGMSISRVEISKRLGEAPAIIAAEQNGLSSNMERVAASQAQNNGMSGHETRNNRVFEFNPRHPFMIKLNEMVTPPEGEDDFTPEQAAKDLAWMIHDTAILNSGYTIKSIPGYTKRMTRILKSQMDVDDVGLEEEINPSEDDDIPEDEEEVARMADLNKNLPPGYQAGEPQVLIP